MLIFACLDRQHTWKTISLDQSHNSTHGPHLATPSVSAAHLVLTRVNQKVAENH